MSRFLFIGLVCWAASATTSFAVSTDEVDVVRELDAWDAAVAARDLNALTALAADGYDYVEPDPHFVQAASADLTTTTLQTRLLDRVTRDIG